MSSALTGSERKAKSITHADFENGHFWVNGERVARDTWAMVDGMVRVLMLAHGLLETREGFDKPGWVDAEGAEAYFAAEDLVSHHNGESQGGMCWFCYLQTEVARVLGGSS